MHTDVVDLRNFYGEPLGHLVRRMLRMRLRAMWPRVGGDRVLGIGYATPFLRPFKDEADRVIAFMPAQQGVVNWPAEGPSASALVCEDEFPLADSSVDRVLLVHALEQADDPRALMREVWRVLAPGGRVIAVVPNRVGIWARSDTTPFGYGRPFTRGQISTLLKDTLFSPIDYRGAFYFTPYKKRVLIRTAPMLERLGATLMPGLSGVILVEATKQMYQGIPALARSRGRSVPLFRPVLIPQARTGDADSAPPIMTP